MRRTLIATMLVGLMVLTGCEKKKEEIFQEAPGTLAETDSMVGRWPGVEGTFLEVEKSTAMGKYVITVQDLDGPKKYEGVAVGDQIEFTRTGKTETIHAGNGQDTGMKWLLDKKNCLVINKGSEGFCRD